MTRTIQVVLLWSALGASVAGSQPTLAKPALQQYALDAGHSIVEFSIGFAFSRVKGRFNESRGTILYDPADPSRSSITVVIQSRSLDTGWPHRDEHLKTSDFFDVERFPTIVFQSQSVQRKGDAWMMEGPLTMHGVTKRVTIPFHFLRPPVRSPESGSMILNADGAVRLARKDFGITGGDTFNSWFNKARSATMADSVDVSLEIEGWWADAASQRSAGVDAAAQRIKTDGVEAQISRLRDATKGKTAAELRGYLNGADLVVRALIAADQVPDAVKLAASFPELFPGNTRALAVYGYALAVAGNVKGAAAQYFSSRQAFRPPVPDPNEKFKQVDDNWYYLDQLVRTSLENGRVTPAVGLARHVTELYPDNADAFATYGLALALSGDNRGALIQYDHALQIDPGTTRAMELRRRSIP